MARNTSFLALLDMLREELGRSTNVGVGVDDLPSLKRHINRAYAVLYDDHDWQHLRYVAPRIQLNAGQRYYDFPAALSYERVEEIFPFYNGQALGNLEKGISKEEYAIFDSAADKRSDPVQKWDIQSTASVPQIEVWPMPASNAQTLQLIGTRKMTPLVDDADICLLDGELVTLAAAARLLARQKSEDSKLLLDELAKRLSDMKKRSSPSRRVIMGGGDPSGNRRATVVIAGRS